MHPDRCDATLDGISVQPWAENLAKKFRHHRENMDRGEVWIIFSSAHKTAAKDWRVFASITDGFSIAERVSHFGRLSARFGIYPSIDVKGFVLSATLKVK